MINFEKNKCMKTPIVALMMEEQITLYCKAWGKPDHELRRSMLDSIMESSARYTDPKVDFISVAELSNHIGQVHSKWPGAKIVRTSGLDFHHNVARFAWQLVLADGTVAVEGINFAEFSSMGKISRIISFFGPMQPLSV
jgi:hypothetical protein